MSLKLRPSPSAKREERGVARTWTEEVERLRGTGTLRAGTGTEKPVAYQVVVTQEVRERSSLQGALPDARGRYHIEGSAILGEAFGISQREGLILRLDDGRELKVVFTLVSSPLSPARFRAAVMKPDDWVYR